MSCMSCTFRPLKRYYYYLPNVFFCQTTAYLFLCDPVKVVAIKDISVFMQSYISMFMYIVFIFVYLLFEASA